MEGATACDASIIGAMTSPAIRTTHLSRRFGPVEAVHDLTFEVPAGQVFGFLGPNGAGKTTTIRLLLGLLEPTTGSAEVLGLDTRTAADAIRARTGALLEFPGLYERLSAEDNLDFYLRVWRWPRAARRSRIEEVLTHLGLWERRRDMVAIWSAGMKQKLAVARALIHRPQLLFLDEPSAGLDPAAAAGLLADIRALVDREGVTVFLTSHLLDEVEKLCTSVAILRRGRLIAHATLDELQARANGMAAEIDARGLTQEFVQVLRRRGDVAEVSEEGQGFRVRLGPGAEPAPVVSLMVGNGAAIDEVRRLRPSLEQVYLDLVDEEP